MNTVTIVWSTAAGVCLALAGLHFLVWFQNRKAWASLAFCVTALGAVGHAAAELGEMFSRTPEEWGACMRWSHIASFLAIAGTMSFIHFYLGTGLRWLLLSTIGLRFFILVLNFCLQPGINYRVIHSVRQIPFLGEQVTVIDQAVINPWVWLAQLCFLLWFIFVVDAAVRLWRRGTAEERRRAVVVGGSTALFVLIGAGQAVLTLNLIIEAPLIASIAIQLMVLSISYELSRDVLRAARLTRELHASEQRLTLAASAAKAVLWEWRVDRDEIWASSGARALFDSASDQPLDFHHLTKTLHPDDRERVLQVIRQAAAAHGSFNLEYRRVMPGGDVRWIAGSGAAELDATSGATLVRGISVDITESRRAEEALRQQRDQLSHTLRLATMSQMAASLAHELNQPLTAMVNNAGAGRRMLAKGVADETELTEILGDIAADGHRAGEVIRGIRALSRRDEVPRVVMDIHEALHSMRRMIAAEALAREAIVTEDLAPALPQVEVNVVQIQQVLLNLVINALDALDMPGAVERRVIIQTRQEGADTVCVSVRDFGPGLPPEGPEKLFEQFFTTKPNGMGMGLVIVRNIVEAHGGSLTAANAEGGGARFQFRLHVAKIPLHDLVPPARHRH